eukprot:1331618-Prymnesium_polylepis.1
MQPSGHVGACTARRPAFSRGAPCSPPASAVSRRETPLTIRVKCYEGSKYPPLLVTGNRYRLPITDCSRDSR